MSRGSTKESLPSPTGRNMALFFLSSQDSTFEANVPGRRMVHGIPWERIRCSLSRCHCASGVGAMKSASTCRAESLTICPTPPFLAASKALPSIARSIGPAESTNALSTPAKAGASVSGFSRSTRTTSTALGNLSAFFGSRTSARTLWPVSANCLTSSLPTVPVAPVTKINGFAMNCSCSGFITRWMPYDRASYCSIRLELGSVDHVRCGGHAAVDLDRCPGDVAGPWGRQESDDLGHFRGRSEPAQRQAPRDALAERGNHLGRQRELIEGGRVDGPRTERIDPNSPRRKLGGQRWNERGNRALSRAVDGPAGKALMRSDRAREQDRSAFREKRKNLLEGEELAFHVDVEMFVEGRFVDCLERQQAYDPGVKKREVDPTETLLHLACDAICVGKNPRVSPQDCDLAGQTAPRRGNCFGGLSRNHHREPLLVQNSRRGEADAAGTARNERRRS